MAKAKTHTSDALEILDRRIGDDPEMRAMIVQERLNGRIAQMIYDARMKAGLTQQQVGTSKVLDRVETDPILPGEYGNFEKGGCGVRFPPPAQGRWYPYDESET